MIRVSRRAARAGLREGDSASPPARALLDSSFASFERPRGAAFQLSLTLLAALSDSGPYPALGGWHLPHSRYTLKQRYCTSTRAGPTGLSPCVAGPSRPLAPAAMHTRNSLGPGSSPFARRYSGNRLCFLLLGLLICLSSARRLARHRAERTPPTARPKDPPPRSCAAAPHAGFPPRIRKVTIRIGLRLAATNLAPFYVLRRRPSPVVHCCPFQRLHKLYCFTPSATL